MSAVSSATLAALAVALLSAPLAVPVAAKSQSAAQILVTRISSAIARCWFAKGETDFAAYRYAPETNAIVGPPRILIVSRKAPHGRPALVIEIDADGWNNNVNIYGPLTESDLGERIAADITRWARGGKACS